MRKEVEPTVKKTEDGYEESHPSYGMVRIGRVHGGHSNLYGSSVSHQQYIELVISRGKRLRNLNTDWYFAQEQLFTIKLSANQFAELITTPNQGSGVPCTLARMDGKAVPDCPERHRRQEVQEELDERMKRATDKAVEAEQLLVDLAAKGRKVSKSDIHDLRGLVTSALCELRDNVPYAQECFNEACDKAVVEAKAEVDAAFTHLINRLGTSELQRIAGVSDSPRLMGESEGTE